MNKTGASLVQCVKCHDFVLPEQRNHERVGVCCDTTRARIQSFNPSGMHGRIDVTDLMVELVDQMSVVGQEITAEFGTQVRPDFW